MKNLFKYSEFALLADYLDNFVFAALSDISIVCAKILDRMLGKKCTCLFTCV